MKKTSTYLKIIIGLSTIAALLYNVWPLDFILDPGVLNNSYFSVLEVSNKPYSYFFIISGLLAGVVIILIGILLAKLYTSNKIVLLYFIFGFGTVIEDIIPISNNCIYSIKECGISPSQIFTVHDSSSIFAYLALPVILLLLLFSNKYKVGKCLFKWVKFIFCAYLISSIILVLSVVLHSYTIYTQAIFLISSGITIILIPLSVIDNESSQKEEIVD